MFLSKIKFSINDTDRRITAPVTTSPNEDDDHRLLSMITFPCIITVSYTHLDVYKRQQFKSSQFVVKIG